MNKKFILVLLATILITSSALAVIYNNDELNKRLISCKPTKNFDAGNSTIYQISGLTGSICVFKIEHTAAVNKPNLICKVPYTKMHEMTSVNPLVVQNLKNRYCIMNVKSLNKTKVTRF